MRLPQSLNSAQTYAYSLGNVAAGPVRGFSQRFGAGQCRILATIFKAKGGATGLAGLITQQSVDARLGVTRLPTPHRGSTDAGAAGYFRHGQPFGREQDDLRALNVLASAITVGGVRDQPEAGRGC